VKVNGQTANNALISPHRLLQELVPATPWHIFVVCILQNRTTGAQVEAVIDRLFARYPTARDLAMADVAELEALLRPLGLWRRRPRILIAMSRQVADGGWSDPLDLPGIGPYARDSYEIFVRRNLDVEPRDSWLKRYLEFARGMEGKD
jgi:methyl-CpG-binding domain protein 4